jgi:hypothetical protein
MLEWLGKVFGSDTAVVSGRRNPAFLSAVQSSALIFQALPEKRHLDETARQRLARQLYLDLHEVFIAAIPVDALRQKIAEAMLRYSLFQVLLIPPVPEADTTGLRGLPGITGGLMQERDAVIRNSSELHEALYENGGDQGGLPVELLLRRAHAGSSWCVQTFDAVRKELGDTTEGRDWYRPYLFAVCANQESRYRRDIDMPPAFEPGLAASAPVAYSLFTDIVLSGAKDPLAEWLEYHRDAGIPMPRFDESADVPARSAQ